MQNLILMIKIIYGEVICNISKKVLYNIVLLGILLIK